jgi:two-component system phosphate regulon sensor histidine kinase PhoR
MIILGTLSLAGIIAVQVYWISLSVTAEEETFDHNVRMSLRAVADNMCQIDGNELISNKPIDRISRNYFVARLRYNIDISVLDSLIKYQFENRNIDQDYEYGVYNCDSDQMVFGNQVTKTDNPPNRLSLPKLSVDEYYFGVYFPNKTGGLLASISIWKYMTGGTLLMLGFFAYGLVVVLKQRRLSEIQKDFIDNVTHELKTPLATLRLSAEAIKKGDDPSRVSRYAQIIDQETRRLEKQVEQILEASIMEHGKCVKKPVDMSNYLSELTDRLQLSHPQIKWEFNLDPIGVVEIDQNYLNTILHNLIDNAIKYGNGEVKLSVGRSDDSLQITIADDGPGIPKKYAKQIYHKFFRIPTDNIHDVKGHGLGMYLVKAAVSKIKGSIHLNLDKKGAEFIIILPI